MHIHHEHSSWSDEDTASEGMIVSQQGAHAFKIA